MTGHDSRPVWAAAAARHRRIFARTRARRRRARHLLALCLSPESIRAGQYAVMAGASLKPVAGANLVSFVRRSIVHAFLPNERVSAWVDEYARIKKLTPREVQLLAYEFGNESRRSVTQRLGVTDNTVKSQVRSLLRKFGVPTMDALAMHALREVISSQGGGAQRLLSCPPCPLSSDVSLGWSMD